ncbi:hypothetical protein QUB68_04865 [Microcoleus sp. A006_D1]|uniref:hypothetical protein n=1 Tax=Microcoleus sp. A006_D1 TaxID=3055267 RepID=UPI002FD0CE8E
MTWFGVLGDCGKKQLGRSQLVESLQCLVFGVRGDRLLFAVAIALRDSYASR